MDDAPGGAENQSGGSHLFIRLGLKSDCAPTGFCFQIRERRIKGVWGGGMCKRSQSSIVVLQPSYKNLG